MDDNEESNSVNDVEGYQAASSSSASGDEKSKKEDDDTVTEIVTVKKRSSILSTPSKNASSTKVFPRRRRSSDFSSRSMSIDDDLSVSSLESQKLDNEGEIRSNECSNSDKVLEVRDEGEKAIVYKVESTPTQPPTVISVTSVDSTNSKNNIFSCPLGIFRTKSTPKFLLISLVAISIFSIWLYIFILYSSIPASLYNNRNLFNVINSFKYSASIVGGEAFKHFSKLSDVLITSNIENDLPFLWGTYLEADWSILDMLGSCYHLSQASTFRGKKHLPNSPLYVVKMNGMKYVNVDLFSTIEIDRAIRVGLADSNLADIVASPHLHDMANLFTYDHRGRMIVVLKHPIERSLEIYYKNLQQDLEHNTITTRGENKTSTKGLAYAYFKYDNWLTRNLNNIQDPSIKLTSKHLDIAKEILQHKFLIGKIDKIQESMRRFKTYFGWNVRDGDSSCEDYSFMKIVLANEKSKKIRNNIMSKYFLDKEDLDVVYSMNSFDLELYEYANELFNVQGKLLFDGLTS